MQEASGDYMCGGNNEGPGVFTTTSAIYQTKFQHKSFLDVTTWSAQQHHIDLFCSIFADQNAKRLLENVDPFNHLNGQCFCSSGEDSLVVCGLFKAKITHCSGFSTAAHVVWEQ